jgi:hypothetical protein
MDIDSPEQILTMIQAMQLAQQPLQRNRTLINALFNGESPWTDDEADAENVNTRVNWLHATRIASNATNQLNAAFFKGDRYFSVRVDKGPVRLRAPVSAIITKGINRELKRCRAYRAARESAHAQVVLHGPGPMPWRDRYCPYPSTGGIDDLIIPAGTLCDMSNLDRFAFYRELTWRQLNDAAFGKGADPSWNRDYVKALMATLYKTGMTPIYQGNRWLFPEKMAEDYKEGASWTSNSTLPRLLAWDFFYCDEETGKWNRRIVLDYSSIGAATGDDGKPLVRDTDAVMKNREVLYERDNYADDWSEVLHFYTGNCSNVAPYRYHSMRSIGFLLFGACLTLNKLMCRQVDHMFQQLLTLFRNVSEDNREQLGLVDLHNFGVLPQGVNMVPANERYLVDPRFIELGVNQMTQLIAQSAMSFVPDLDGVSKDKAMTATETLVRQNQSVSLTSAVIGQLADQSTYEYREICRRFCIKDNPHPMAKKFRDELKKEGIDLDEYLDVDAWDVVPEVAVGAGNKASELMVTQALMQELYPIADAEGQRLVARRRYSALTDNPDEAMMIWPEVPSPAGNDAQQAQNAFGILMDLHQPMVPDGVNHIVMVSVLVAQGMQSLQQAELAMQQPSGLSIAVEKVAGVANVAAFAQQELVKVSQMRELPGMKQIVAELDKQLKGMQGALMQIGKAVQAAEEQMQPQMSGEEQKLQAKLMDIKATGDLNRQLAAASANQKLEQRQVQWLSTTQQKEAGTQAEIQRTDARTAAELRASLIKAQGDTLINIQKEAKKPAPKATA